MNWITTGPVYLASSPSSPWLVGGARRTEVKLTDGQMKFMVDEHISGLVDRLQRRSLSIGRQEV
jgi:hypothetical protein